MRASVKRATEASACALKLRQLQHTVSKAHVSKARGQLNQSQPIIIVFTVFAREF